MVRVIWTTAALCKDRTMIPRHVSSRRIASLCWVAHHMWVKAPGDAHAPPLDWLGVRARRSVKMRTPCCPRPARLYGTLAGFGFTAPSNRCR